ncbi:hypothetical protein GCM10009765_04900 [Fodinicola feengrottensis]|uniref:Uncharacterized protein n=1 Tax=Fodinicola feengrottensis TaxID=435914 RepID=A0ABN2FSR0_9ACTN
MVCVGLDPEVIFCCAAETAALIDVDHGLTATQIFDAHSSGGTLSLAQAASTSTQKTASGASSRVVPGRWPRSYVNSN